MLAACSSEQPGYRDPPRGPAIDLFEDVTAHSGVAFEYQPIDFKGGGLAVGDFDGDGRPDLLATNRAAGHALYLGRGNLQFELAGDRGIDVGLGATALAAVDLDNDGDLDLVFAGDGHAVIFANDGTAQFTKIATLANTGGPTEHVLAADLDGDGLLDLYFGNYHPAALDDHTVNRLFMNHGGFSFGAPQLIGAGLTWSTTAFDVDGDGDLDLYVANDTLLVDFGAGSVGDAQFPSDSLLRNDGLGSDGAIVFTDIAAAEGLTEPRSSMGGTLADIDGDGTLDIYIPNDGAKKLFLTGSSPMTDAAKQFGIEAPVRETSACGASTMDPTCALLSWGAIVSDFDLDGRDDLVVDSGDTVLDQPPPMLMFQRADDGAPFHEVSPGFAQLDGRGMVATDLDGDGDQDVVISQRQGPLVIYRNKTTPRPGSWLRVRLHATRGNRDGVGALVTITLANGRTQQRLVGAGGMINTASPLEAYFGLDAEVTNIVVRWPQGEAQSYGPATGDVLLEQD